MFCFSFFDILIPNRILRAKPHMKNDLTVFEDHQIRRVYDEKAETWFFSVIDIVQILTVQPDYQSESRVGR